jgi:hypothetical protein
MASDAAVANTAIFIFRREGWQDTIWQMSALHVIQLGRMTVTFIMSERQTCGYLDVFEVTLPADGRIIVPHRHPDCDDTVIGLDGITSWTVDG